MFQWIYSHTRALEKSLDGVWLRNKVISNNISNVDTPGFKASKVVFEEALASALKRERKFPLGDSRLDEVEPVVVQDLSTTMRMDGNNVDIDSEMANLAKNTIQYNALIQKISKDFARIKTVINEGKR